tara:strand:+ start:213 stop:575 length:363 start_codon:yes stop_codon:yes gene_type:complete
MLTFTQLAEKKSKIKINPKKEECLEDRKHKEDCQCQKCEDKEEEKVVEEVEEVDEKISASGYARAKKWREDQARQKDREDNAKWEEKARTHKWDGKTWNKRDKPTHEKGTGPHARKLAGE